jgi:pentatricopeptide repeat protein
MSVNKPTATSTLDHHKFSYDNNNKNLAYIERLSPSLSRPDSLIQSSIGSNLTTPSTIQDTAISSNLTVKSCVETGRLDYALTLLLQPESTKNGITDFSSKDRRLLFAALSDLSPSELAALISPWIQRQRDQYQDYLYNKRLGQLLKILGSTLPMDLVTHLLCSFPLDNSVQTAMFGRFVKNYMATESDDQSTAHMDALLKYLDPMSTGNISSPMDIKVRLYNMALNGCLKRGNRNHVNKILDHMESSGCLLDAASFNMLIRSRLDDGDIEAATALYGQMMATGTSSSAPTVATYNTFISYACQHQLWSDMTLWLDRLLLKDEQQPNPVTLRILMAALTDHIDQQVVVDAFDRVVKMVPVKSLELERTVNTSIVHLLRHKHTDQALDILYQLFGQSSSIETYGLSVYTYNLMIHALTQKGQLEAAERVLKSMRDQQPLHDGDTTTTQAIPLPDIVSYTTLIHGYVRSPHNQDIDIGRILTLYKELMDRGLETNAVLQAVVLYGMVKSGFQDIKECAALFESMISDNGNDGDTLDFSDTMHRGRSYEPQWHFYNDIGSTRSNLGSKQRKMDPKMSQMTLYNMMMDGYFIHQTYERNRRHRASSPLSSLPSSSPHDGTTISNKRQRHIPPESLALLNRAIENKLPLTTATLNIWVRGLALFNYDLVAAESMVEWMTMTHGVALNERTILYLVQSSLAQDRRDKARKWIKLYEDSGRVIQGTGLRYFKDLVIKS